MEECLVGEECWLMGLVEEERVIGMVLWQDDKWAFEGELGWKIGGMGGY